MIHRRNFMILAGVLLASTALTSDAASAEKIKVLLMGGRGHDWRSFHAVISEVLDKTGDRGQVVYYGCPAEETLAGKVYMARDGGFRDLDACLAWHPGSGSGVNNAGGSSLDSLVYEFFGRTAHGASAHTGRSALDAVMLTDIAANYLREHVPENVRIHSVIRDGGDAPNVVPAYGVL